VTTVEVAVFNGFGAKKCLGPLGVKSFFREIKIDVEPNTSGFLFFQAFLNFL